MKSIRKFSYVLLLLFFVSLIIEIISYFFFIYISKTKFNHGYNVVNHYLGRNSSEQIIIPHPFILYDNNPKFEYKSKNIYNDLGYRNESDFKEKDSKTFRILCIGGSTTNSYPYISDNKWTWTQQLENKLNSYHSDSLKIEVLNAGLPFATSAEFLSSYIFKHRYINPDMVILELGGNDISACFFENYRPDYSHFRGHGNGYYPRKYEINFLKSNFIKVLYSFWLNNEEIVYKSTPYSFTKLDEKTIKRVLDCDFSGFERNVDLLIRNIICDSAQVVIVPFVQVADSLIEFKEPMLKNIGEAQALGYKKMISSLNKIVQKHPVKLLGLTFNDFEVNDFVDLCHLNIDGERKKAEKIFTQIKDLLNNRK